MFSIENLIYVYIALCVCMMLFNVAYMLVVFFNERSKEKNKNSFVKAINAQLKLIENGIEIKAKHRNYLYRKLKTLNNLLLFEYTLDLNDKQLVEKYKEEIEIVFNHLSIYYSKADTYKKAYYIYIINKYKFSKISSTTLCGFLNEESIYCRINALEAIVNFGELEDIINALKIISNSENYYYPDIVYKALLNFNRDKNNLSKELWNNFEQFNEKMQTVIIRYFNYANLEYKEQFYNLYLEKEISLNIKIEIVRYFKNNIYQKANELLINIANLHGVSNQNLILEAAISLRSYNSLETKKVLKTLMKKSNWKIKNAACESLIALGCNYYELIDIYNGDDEVVRSILKYKVQTRKLKYKSVEEAAG